MTTSPHNPPTEHSPAPGLRKNYGAFVFTQAVIILLVLLLSSCGSKSLSPAAYVAYMEDGQHPLSEKQEIGSNEYTIRLATPEYMACKETEPSDTAAQQISHRIKELEGHLFFLIKIGSTAKSRELQGGKRLSADQLDVNRKVAYYDQQAIHDISISKGGNTITPSTYVFENNYELSPYNTIVVGFETGAETDDLELTFNDRYTNTLAIRAYFSKQTLAGLPPLTIK